MKHTAHQATMLNRLDAGAVIARQNLQRMIRTRDVLDHENFEALHRIGDSKRFAVRFVPAGV